MDARFRAGAAVTVIVLLAGALLYIQRRASDGHEPYDGPPATPGAAQNGPEKTLNITLNTEPSDYPRLRALGYDLVDVKPDASSIAGVPDGMRALLWVGNFHCDEFELSFEEFTEAVQRLKAHPKVYGWYLSDEPNPRECPQIADEIKRRADLIQREAPDQIAFISLTDFPMAPVTPKRVNVDLVGLDPYPCKGSSRTRSRCDIGAIDRMVRMADKAGIPREVVVPVFQTFGQSCSDGDKQYWLPTEDQLHQILRRWDRLVPDPPMDIAYSWGRQSRWACPTLSDATGGEHPDLQSIMRARNT